MSSHKIGSVFETSEVAPCWSLHSCRSGVESACYYRKVAGLIPQVCMLKCPWSRYRTSNSSGCAGQHLAWHHQCMNVLITVSLFGQKLLINALKCKCKIHTFVFNTRNIKLCFCRLFPGGDLFQCVSDRKGCIYIYIYIYIYI